jgi:hypothetical protein
MGNQRKLIKNQIVILIAVLPKKQIAKLPKKQIVIHHVALQKKKLVMAMTRSKG